MTSLYHDVFADVGMLTEKETGTTTWRFCGSRCPWRAGRFVLPFGDSPMDNEQVGEQLYLDILNQAEDYVHIVTPYLILDDEMEKRAFRSQAGRGRDPDQPHSRQAVRVPSDQDLLPELIDWSGVKVCE